jgi:hypothetical protein
LKDHNNQLKEKDKEEKHEICAAVVLEGFVCWTIPANQSKQINYSIPLKTKQKLLNLPTKK